MKKNMKRTNLIIISSYTETEKPSSPSAFFYPSVSSGVTGYAFSV